MTGSTCQPPPPTATVQYTINALAAEASPAGPGAPPPASRPPAVWGVAQSCDRAKDGYCDGAGSVLSVSQTVWGVSCSVHLDRVHTGRGGRQSASSGPTLLNLSRWDGFCLRSSFILLLLDALNLVSGFHPVK